MVHFANAYPRPTVIMCRGYTVAWLKLKVHPTIIIRVYVCSGSFTHYAESALLMRVRKGGGRAKPFANMSAEFKKGREISWPLHGQFNCHKGIYRQLRGAVIHTLRPDFVCMAAVAVNRGFGRWQEAPWAAPT